MDEKYSAALERAKVVIFNAYHEETKTACKEIFPELAESDDEMTRKELLDFISSPDVSRMLDEEKQAKFYAYIEKQKEQKPVKMVHIPKFRVGDIVQHVNEKWDRTMKIAEIDGCGYRYDFSHRGHPEWGGGFTFVREDDYELVQQKPAEWTDADEKILERIINRQKFVIPVPGAGESPFLASFEHREDAEAINWLKRRLASRPQQEQEWSEEDERILKRLIRDYDEAVRSDNGGPWGKVFQENLAWLKSRRPQPNNNLRWRRATDGANIPESIIIPDGEEPRFGKCAVKNSYYIPISELKELPKE